jgi:single stranded DNA-binding protein
VNSVNLVGRIGFVSELLASAGGRHVLRLRVATDDSHVGRDGESKTRTSWHTVKVFDRAAEWLQRQLEPGVMVSVQGRLVSWEADGAQGKTSIVEVEAFRVVPLRLRARRREAGACVDEGLLDEQRGETST